MSIRVPRRIRAKAGIWDPVHYTVTIRLGAVPFPREDGCSLSEYDASMYAMPLNHLEQGY